MPGTPPETEGGPKDGAARTPELRALAEEAVLGASEPDYPGGMSGSLHATITHTRLGPIPAAAEFAEYQRIFPGAGQWLLDQAALDAEHLRDMERRSLQLAHLHTSLQHVVPAVTVTVALVTSGAIAVFANAGAGAAVFAATIASILTAYLTGQPGKISATDGDSVVPEKRGRGD